MGKEITEKGQSEKEWEDSTPIQKTSIG